MSDDLSADVILNNITHATCGGGGGAINVNVSGGTPAYSYVWGGLPDTTPTITGLSAGSYSVTVTDNNGCTAITIIDVNEPAVLTASATATESFYAITCYSAGNIEVQGGGRFEYVNIDGASGSDVVKYINPDTGQPFPGVVDGSAGDLADGKATGFYEKIPTEKTTIALAVGQTVYGDFTVVSTPASDQASVLAYYK